MSNTARKDRLLKASLADFHEYLGWYCVKGNDGSPSPLRDLAISPEVDWGCLDRLTKYAAERRAEMGESRWTQLNKEWNA
jgi:alkyl sulfatase BDS1-like metallo-beta-lactamase superfamily hydrolase